MYTPSLEDLLKYSPNPISEIVEGDALEKLLLDKVTTLSGLLTQINKDISGRFQVSTNLIELIQKNYRYLKAKLYELDIWQLGTSRIVDNRRSKLEQELEKLNQEERAEQVKCWQDVEGLRKEFRQWLKEYSDTLRRVK